MALGIFKHLSLAQLETLHSEAITALTNGKNRIISSTGSGDVNVTKEWQLDNKLFWDELNWALEYKGASSYTPRVRRTSISYH